LRVAVVRSEKLLVEAEDISGTQRKGTSTTESHYQTMASEDCDSYL
jgi:hypothetical protein